MSIKKLARDDFSALGERGFYSVDLGGFELQFFFKPSKQRTAYVFSPGWLDRSTFPHPYFQRSSWLDELDGVGLSLADPSLSLSDEVQIGWFIGSEKISYPEIVTEYIAALLRWHGVEPSNTVFFGSSAGGFASLVFASMLPGTTALAVNPQINVLQFHDVHELGKYLKAAFPGRSLSYLERVLPHRFNLAHLWRSLGRAPNATILLNKQDHWHYNHHALPLMTAMAEITLLERFSLQLYNDPIGGHNPPGKEALLPMLRELGTKPQARYLPS